jgi:hypothetical protein
VLGAVRAHWNEKSRVTLDRMHEEGVAAPLTSGLMPLPEMRPIPASAARPNHVFPDHVQPVEVDSFSDADESSVDRSSVRLDDRSAAHGNASNGALGSWARSTSCSLLRLTAVVHMCCRGIDSNGGASQVTGVYGGCITAARSPATATATAAAFSRGHDSTAAVERSGTPQRRESDQASAGPAAAAAAAAAGKMRVGGVSIDLGATRGALDDFDRLFGGGGGGGEDDDGLSLGGSDEDEPRNERLIANHIPEDRSQRDDPPEGDRASSWAMTATTTTTTAEKGSNKPSASPLAVATARRGMSVVNARATARIQNRLVMPHEAQKFIPSTRADKAAVERPPSARTARQARDAAAAAAAAVTRVDSRCADLLPEQLQGTSGDEGDETDGGPGRHAGEGEYWEDESSVTLPSRTVGAAAAKHLALLNQIRNTADNVAAPSASAAARAGYCRFRPRSAKAQQASAAERMGEAGVGPATTQVNTLASPPKKKEQKSLYPCSLPR